MKEDYLWDKTGADAEIEMFERALAEFRYRETAPPAIPAKVIPFKKASARRIFSAALAAAACMALAVLALSVWLQASNSGEIKVKDAVAEIKPRIELQPRQVQSDLAVNVNPEIVPAKIEISTASSARKLVRIRKKAPAILPQREMTARKIEAKSDVRLTKEEQYAYEQLMLALSITGSKLKEVKDKVEGME